MSPILRRSWSALGHLGSVRAVGKTTAPLPWPSGRRRDLRTRFVELYADLDERLERNTTELRLDRKPSKRDLGFSRANLLELNRDYVMNTDGARRAHAEDLIERHDHVRIDNTRSTPAETAALILRRMPQ
ncbi:hypothetical protein [Amycolatopsis sp. EV170708-02-1]|uniref:hypothetical protein n=1 Tax=Amycolatopsis sp. EV170708-02-1 TaxID=2919322 RepID=UPI001F0C40D8|nr:hypothetical protein [Amycolatopsis sp. EV170708-02-1]UMP04528.1 hypothetical protein MJQ72_06705 [Amycolatopsis sp. EV170708-02-1]